MPSIVRKVSPVRFYLQATSLLDKTTTWQPQLFLRSLLAWEFLESGLEKYHGKNWFSELQFPFPFNLVSIDVSWNLATYFEIFGAIALFVGFATRFFTVSLMILTIVAILTVHIPEQVFSLADLIKGYRLVDEAGDGFGNYKLPVIYLIMFMPLLLGGAGKLSLDAWIKNSHLIFTFNRSR
jgi:putative oxidoreductase